MEPILYTTYHMVKSEDLNHHGTLYAGRSASWFVEASFIAAAGLSHPENIVCLKIHSMEIIRPVRAGEIVKFESRVIFAGRTRLVVSVLMKSADALVLNGFITYIHVDEHGKPQPHGIIITPTLAEDIALQEIARDLR